MAEFQQNVLYAYAAGLPGEIAADGPLRAQSFRLVANAAQVNATITFGNAFTYASLGDVANPNGLAVTQTATPGQDASAGAFAGILINPKAHALYGTVSGGPLAPSYQLPDGSWGELATMGIFFANVTSVAAAVAGASLGYDVTTGALTTAAASATIIKIPGAFLNSFLPASPNPQLARITLTGPLPA